MINESVYKEFAVLIYVIIYFYLQSQKYCNISYFLRILYFIREKWVLCIVNQQQTQCINQNNLVPFKCVIFKNIPLKLLFNVRYYLVDVHIIT